MIAAALDPTKIAKTLKAAGVPPEQAEAQARIFIDICEALRLELTLNANLRAVQSPPATSPGWRDLWDAFNRDWLTILVTLLFYLVLFFVVLLM